MIRLAVIGHPIAHSLSPVMHRAALDALGRSDVTYEAIDVAPKRLGVRLTSLASEGFVGLNVTLPHKTAVLAHLSSIDETARALGAVNTLTRVDEGWVGTNTDVIGLARSLDEAKVAIEGARVVVLGAGGAARACMLALATAGEVRVAARKLDAARAVANLHPRGRAITFDALTLDGIDLLVQASSATLGSDAEAFVDSLPLARLSPSTVVVDLVYRPRETALLARVRGLRTVDGVGMLVHQGAASFERWLGVKPSIEAMRAAVLAAL